jgi:hypothetical protein
MTAVKMTFCPLDDNLTQIPMLWKKPGNIFEFKRPSKGFEYTILEITCRQNIFECVHWPRTVIKTASFSPRISCIPLCQVSPLVPVSPHAKGVINRQDLLYFYAYAQCY